MASAVCKSVSPEAKKSRIDERHGARNGKIPEEIPEERNTHIENIKKRRSSLRRSINGGFTSTLRAACSSIDESLPPSEKIKRIVELCINQTLLSLRNSSEEDDAFLPFEKAMQSKTAEILRKIKVNVEGAQKQETELRKHINRLKEEKILWNDEFAARRNSYTEARAKLKDITKEKVFIEKANLKPEDLMFLNSLPDFTEMNKQITTYQNRHHLGMIELERSAKNVYHNLLMSEKQIIRAQKIMAPSFSWPS